MIPMFEGSKFNLLDALELEIFGSGDSDATHSGTASGQGFFPQPWISLGQGFTTLHGSNPESFIAWGLLSKYLPCCANWGTVSRANNIVPNCMTSMGLPKTFRGDEGLSNWVCHQFCNFSMDKILDSLFGNLQIQFTNNSWLGREIVPLQFGQIGVVVYSSKFCPPPLFSVKKWRKKVKNRNIWTSLCQNWKKWCYICDHCSHGSILSWTWYKMNNIFQASLGASASFVQFTFIFLNVDPFSQSWPARFFWT